MMYSNKTQNKTADISPRFRIPSSLINALYRIEKIAEICFEKKKNERKKCGAEIPLKST